MPQTIQKNGWFGQNSQMGNCWGKINCTRHVRSTICKKKKNETLGKSAKFATAFPLPFHQRATITEGHNCLGGGRSRGLCSLQGIPWKLPSTPTSDQHCCSQEQQCSQIHPWVLHKKNDRRTINIKQVPNVVNQCCDGCSAPCNILSIDQGRFQAIL